MAMDATNRLSAIAAEMGQLQNEIQEPFHLIDSAMNSADHPRHELDGRHNSY